LVRVRLGDVISTVSWFAATISIWLVKPWPGRPGPIHSTPNIFAPASTPADSIQQLSLFVLTVCGAIFLVVSGLLLSAVLKFRRRPDDDGRAPAQIYGSNQVELAWTVMYPIRS
jgi:heme/copper-type cytochrome/quinol oxidase subunit 2